MSAGIIQKQPDPSHEPEVGDEYISSVTGVLVRVTKVEDGRVHFRNNSGWHASCELEWFKNRSRRVLAREAR